MKQTLHISAEFDQPKFLQNLIEQLAYRRYDLGYGAQLMPAGQVALETSSTEAYVSGEYDIESGKKNEHFHVPFITCFLFTCIKGLKEPYHLTWGCSMN